MASYIGTRVYVAEDAPATFNKAGYEALTWVEVTGVVVAPIPGWETESIPVPDLTSGITKSEKGASTGRVSEMSFRRVDADAGQADVKEYASPAYVEEVSIKLVEPTGTNTHVYMTGIMMNYLENEGTVESYQGFTASFQQNYQDIRTTAPA